MLSLLAIPSVIARSIGNIGGLITGKTSGVFFTNGFKIVEVDANTTMLWTRLCSQASPNPIRHERIEKVFRHPIDFDENQEVDKMDGAVI